MSVLLDANVLVALLVDDHVHHTAAEDWFSGLTENFATCPVTQGSLLRLLPSPESSGTGRSQTLTWHSSRAATSPASRRLTGGWPRPITTLPSSSRCLIAEPSRMGMRCRFLAAGEREQRKLRES